MPPTLRLPVPVTNLTAVRTGGSVSLTWTMPKKTTDKLAIKGSVAARVCRVEGSGPCEPVPASHLAFPPAAIANFTYTLPAALGAGAPRTLTYFVELLSPRGRSAGLSNGAHVLAGEAPPPVAGLAVQLRKDGVVLRWTAGPEAEQSSTVIRLHRTLLKAAAKPSKSDSQRSFFSPSPEPAEQTFLIDSTAAPGRAIDKTIRFGETYEYRAQRVARVTVDGQTVELAGALSDPVRVAAVDTFPPAAPTGLAAVATAAAANTPVSIDLSWLPIAETDVAGYAVYRREGDGAWQRVSASQPVIGPAFHDADVQPGHTYRYAVTALDRLDHESARSPEAEETVPNP